MPKHSRTAALEIIRLFEEAGMQIIPRFGHDASIRGRFGPAQHVLLRQLLPDLSRHWREVVEILAGRDGNEAAKASLRLLMAESGDESFAATMGRVGGLKGGKARAAALTPTQRAAIARKAATARWGKRDASKRAR